MTTHERIYGTSSNESKIPSIRGTNKSFSYRKIECKTNSSGIFGITNASTQNLSNCETIAKNPRLPCFKSSPTIKKESDARVRKIPVAVKRPQTTPSKRMQVIKIDDADAMQQPKKTLSQISLLDVKDNNDDEYVPSLESDKNIVEHSKMHTMHDKKNCGDSSFIVSKNLSEQRDKSGLCDTKKKSQMGIKNHTENIPKDLPSWYPGFFAAKPNGQGSFLQAFQSKTNQLIRFAWFSNKDF